MAIPAAYRRALGLAPGDEVLLALDDDSTIRITTPAEALDRARRAVRKHVSRRRRLADELIAERRQLSG